MCTLIAYRGFESHPSVAPQRVRTRAGLCVFACCRFCCRFAVDSLELLTSRVQTPERRLRPASGRCPPAWARSSTPAHATLTRFALEFRQTKPSRAQRRTGWPSRSNYGRSARCPHHRGAAPLATAVLSRSIVRLGWFPRKTVKPHCARKDFAPNGKYLLSLPGIVNQHLPHFHFALSAGRTHLALF